MTVVSYLKLNKNSGIGCVDERESHGIRTYDVADKIFGLTPYSFLSFAGHAPHGIEIVETAREKIGELENKSSSLKNVVEKVEQSYAQVRFEKLQKGFLNKYGVSLQQLVSGQVDETKKRELFQIIENPQGFSVDLLFGGFDRKSDEFKLYHIVYPGVALTIPKYWTIGSGADRADITLGNHLDSLPSHQRENLDLIMGSRIILEATQSAWKNVGVGGRSQMAYIQNGNEVQSVGKNSTTLLHNLIYCEQKGAIESDLVDEAIKGIIEDKTQPEEILKNLNGKIDREEIMNLMFLESLHI